MMMKNMIIWFAFLGSIVSLSVQLFKSSYEKRFYYLDTVRVYSEFDYTKQTNKELEKIIGARKNIIDSLFQIVQIKMEELKYKKNKTESDMELISRMQEDYYSKKEQFDSENQATVSSYNQKIWNQINDYVTQYGKENNYNLLFGANGQGNIMYGAEGLDKTKEIIAFINMKFNDKK